VAAVSLSRELHERDAVMVTSLPQRQLQDLEAELRRRGRSLGDFEVSAQDGMRTADSCLEEVVVRVSIRCLRSGTQRDYRYGQWIPDFLRDLDARPRI
jgi:hypothetical protein